MWFLYIIFWFSWIYLCFLSYFIHLIQEISKIFSISFFFSFLSLLWLLVNPLPSPSLTTFPSPNWVYVSLLIYTPDPFYPFCFNFYPSLSHFPRPYFQRTPKRSQNDMNPPPYINDIFMRIFLFLQRVLLLMLHFLFPIDLSRLVTFLSSKKGVFSFLVYLMVPF